MIKAFICVSLFFVVCGCHRSTDKNIPIIQIQDIKKYDDISYLITVDDMVVLDDSDNGIIIHPDKAFVLPDGNIVFKDKGHRILKFSSTGEYMGQIGARGRGPQEFSLCRDIALSPDGDELSILDLGHILSYDSASGGFLRRIEIPHHNYDEFCYGADGEYILFSASPDTEDYSTFIEHDLLTVISSDGHETCTKLPRKDYILNTSLFTRSYRGITYLRALEGENVLYELDGSSVQPLIEVDFGSLQSPFGYLSSNGVLDMSRYVESKYYKMALNFHDTEDAIYFGCMGPNGSEMQFIVGPHGSPAFSWKVRDDDPAPSMVITSDSNAFYVMIYDVESKYEMEETMLNPLDRLIIGEIKRQNIVFNGNPLLAKIAIIAN